MKKVYSNPEMYICCVDAELTTLSLFGSAEKDNLSFSWDDSAHLNRE